MKIKFAILFFLFPICSFSQDLVGPTAEQYILYKIREVEDFLTNKSSSMNFKLPNEIVCITGISPKDVDGTYIGIVYKPTLEDVKLWREWVSKNHGRFFYENEKINKSKEFDEIYFKRVKVEYEKGKFRNNYCK